MNETNWTLVALVLTGVGLLGVLTLRLSSSESDRMVPRPPSSQASGQAHPGLDSAAAPSQAVATRESVPSARDPEEDKTQGDQFDQGDRPEDPRIASILAAWRSAEGRIADLQARLTQVEALIEAQSEAESRDDRRARPPRTAQERRDALVAAGVGAGQADDILWRESRTELDRLALRDQAVREGWMGSDRYRDELNRLSQEGVSVRDEIGDAAWDRYLHTTGADNRVAVESVIPGSAAEAAGLQPGDLIESYAGERLFEFGELREATTQGESGELVAVRVRRGGALVDVWVPRGPLGVRLDMTRAQPSP